MSGKCSSSCIPRITSAVRRSGSVFTCWVSTPSAARVSRMNRPICSFPTRASMADFNPSRAVPIAVFDGLPPTYLAKLPISSRRPPTCWPYKSTPARPIQMRSRSLCFITIASKFIFPDLWGRFLDQNGSIFNPSEKHAYPSRQPDTKPDTWSPTNLEYRPLLLPALRGVSHRFWR